VALPKILYGVKIWYNPPPAESGAKHTRQRGTVLIMKKISSIQRSGALAITGGLRTSPANITDVLANLLPLELVIDNWCYRAALRLVSLPDSHPL
jgi:hypothetical protein